MIRGVISCFRYVFVSRLTIPKPVKPIVALLSPGKELIKQCASQLEDVIGRMDYASELMMFDYSDYYCDEMGAPLFKRFFSFETLMDPAALPDIKVSCQKIEDDFSVDGKREVNIDPGYISIERLVLATGKNQPHRIYLNRGVWADLTLIYQFGSFAKLSWTYPDYASDQVLRVMEEIRRHYLKQVKAL
jgi:hypothetical protein